MANPLQTSVSLSTGLKEVIGDLKSASKDISAELKRAKAEARDANKELREIEKAQRLAQKQGLSFDASAVKAAEQRLSIKEQKAQDLLVKKEQLKVALADQKEEEEDDQAQNKALMSVMAHMTGVEVRRLEKHSKKANAINEIESFYVKWEETLGNAIERVGHDRALAAKHCEESKDMLRAALTGNSEDDLPTLVARVTEDWDLRYAGG